MTFVRNRAAPFWLASAGASAALLMLSGCGGGSKIASASSKPAPVEASSANLSALQATPGLSPARRYELALKLLQHGDAAHARVELATLRQNNPSDGRVVTLLRQIDTDPQTLYGAESFAYTLRAGDTLFSLAKQYLHDPLNFYGLARFNNLTLPAELPPGRSIMIPGKARPPERPVTVRHARPAAASPSADSGKPTTPAPSAPAVDAARREQARSLRRQGLEQMSAGSIDRAVTLLSQAASLDPQDGTIAADLGRARRIQAAVRTH